MTKRPEYFVIQPTTCENCDGIGKVKERSSSVWLTACPNCDGLGEIQTKVPLLTALQTVGVQFIEKE